MRLRVHQISKAFPGVKALDQVTLEIEKGEIHALCGENGAGKSTLMNILAGNLQPDDGELIIDDRRIELGSPADAFKLGIALVYQHGSLVESLSVAENIFANQQPANWWGVIRFDQLHSDASGLLQLLQINSIHPATRVSKLSSPQKQLVEIAKALSKKPSLLILDEPTAALTDREINVLFAILRRLRQQGVSIVYISHRLDEIFQLADRVSVLKDGKLQGTFAVAGLDKTTLIKQMVGREIVDMKSGSAGTGEILLEVRNLTAKRFRNISFQLHAGEILGIGGLIGAGRTEIARAIFGIDKIKSGSISLPTGARYALHPADAIANGVAYVPEDRKRLGLFADMSIQDNILVASLQKVSSGTIYNRSKAEGLANSYKEKLHIGSPDVAKMVSALSGGNQQKVVLAKWLLTNPQVLIVDEPTQGIDVGAKFEIYEILKSLARQGKGILVISSELPELIGLCDRILVLNNGNLAGEVAGKDATEELILEMAAN